MTDLEKKLNKRWGDTFEDRLNWNVHNEQLFKRGEYLVDLEWVKSCYYELDEMNENKIGRPYIFPNSMIKLQGV